MIRAYRELGMVEPLQRFGTAQWATEGAGKGTWFQVFCDAASALSDEECVGTLHEPGKHFANQGGTADQ